MPSMGRRDQLPDRDALSADFVAAPHAAAARPGAGGIGLDQQVGKPRLLGAEIENQNHPENY
jgi:hypothetical protein